MKDVFVVKVIKPQVKIYIAPIAFIIAGTGNQAEAILHFMI